VQDAQIRARGLDLRFWPTPGSEYHGLIHDDGPDQPQGIILLFHGNAGSALDRTYYISQLEHLGYRVILCEYPGYGARPGKRRQHNLVAAGINATRAAFAEFGRPPILIGESLGCGVASAIAGSQQVPVQGLLLITPWDTLPDLAQSLYWFFPAKGFTRDQYDNIKPLQRFPGPVGVVMAEKDQIIPTRNTQRLFDGLTGIKRLWVLKNVGHNNWPSAADESWWNEVIGFVAGLSPTPQYASPPAAVAKR
jgi:pimeloyl-ACP methyl ester carboxylesterase